MMWRGLVGHDAVAERFRQTLASGRLASTYLFVGPSGIGKRRFAMELARSLLCTETPDAALESCGRCESCRLFAAGNHPDFDDYVRLRPGKMMLAISQFVGYDEELEKEALCHRIALKPYFGGRKIAIVDDADHFSIPSANCLLKTLEEPPESALLILIGTSPARQLPTIRSRSQIVRFTPLTTDAVAEILLQRGALSDPTQASRAAELSGGSVERAVQMADPALVDFRQLLLRELSSPVVESVRLARSVQAFVDEAGKEASLRRDRLRIVIGFAIDDFRTQLRDSGTVPPEAIIQALDACLWSLEYVDRNANLGMVVQQWCEELVSSKSGKAPASSLISVV
jgi:DNA polymerase-3 subunit delta'